MALLLAMVLGADSVDDSGVAGRAAARGLIAAPSTLDHFARVYVRVFVHQLDARSAG